MILLGTNIKTSELAIALGLRHVGPDLYIRSISPISTAKEFSLSFSNAALEEEFLYQATVIAPSEENKNGAAIILSPRPRLDFARALSWIVERGGIPSPTAPPLVHPTATLGHGVRLGNGVMIGARTVIHHNVVIADNVVIGEDCCIKSNTVIGEAGFGFERDENLFPLRLPHLGRVVIGSNVEIGSLNTVCRGTLSDTVIEDYVKTDDHVHIAHNCLIKKGSIITACSELSGGVTVGEFCWIGPNASVLQKIYIGDGASVGIAANVTKDVAPHVLVAGNPAKFLKKLSD